MPRRHRKPRRQRPKPLRLRLPAGRKGPAAVKSGRELEQTVSNVLAQMVSRGEIDSFTRHLPNSPEDEEGKDFTVRHNGTEASFGVSRSGFYAANSQARHGVPVLHIPRDFDTGRHVQSFVSHLLSGAARGGKD